MHVVMVIETRGSYGLKYASHFRPYKCTKWSNYPGKLCLQNFLFLFFFYKKNYAILFFEVSYSTILDP